MPALTIVWMWTPVLVGLCVLFGVLFGWRWAAGGAVMMLMQLVLDQFVGQAGWGNDIVLVASVMTATLVWNPPTNGGLRQIGRLVPAGAVMVVVMHVL